MPHTHLCSSPKTNSTQVLQKEKKKKEKETKSTLISFSFVVAMVSIQTSVLKSLVFFLLFFISVSRAALQMQLDQSCIFSLKLWSSHL